MDMKGNGAGTVFLPKYAFGHWWKLISTPILLLLAFSPYWILPGRDSPNSGINIAIVLLFCLMVLEYLLEILLFCTDGHINRMHIQESGIVLYRPIGGSIESAFVQVEKNEYTISIGKRISFSLDDMVNRNELDLIIPEHIDSIPNARSRWRKMLDNPALHNAAVLFLMAGVVGIFVLWDMLSKALLSDWLIWLSAGGFILIDSYMANHIARNLSARHL